MDSQELARLVIPASIDAYEVYYRFNAALHKVLLVEDASGLFLGVIGAAEVGVPLVPGQTAKDLCNKICTTLCEGEDLVARGRNVFYEHSFFHLPVLSKDGRLADLLLRSDYFEFRVLSYAEGWEDVLLGHLFRDIEDLFYIDVGAYDPWVKSVTTWLYNRYEARGINVEPLPEFYRLLCLDRARDINLNLAVGTEKGTQTLYTQDTLSTFVAEYTCEEAKPLQVNVDTLAAVCDAHVPQKQDVHFLKVDVEGFEGEVLRSADFIAHRPWVVMMEATRPRSEVPIHSEWEDILFRNDYVFVKQYSINRFYLAREKMFLADRFLEYEDLFKRYFVYDFQP